MPASRSHFLGTVLDITARKRSEEAALRRSDQLQKLAAISARLNAANDLASVLGIVTEEARVLIGAQQAVASVAAVPGKRVSSSPWFPTPTRTDPEAALPAPPARPGGLVEDIHGTGARHPRGKPNGSRRCARRIAAAAGGWLAAPLVGRNTQRLGVIQLLDKTADDFTEDDEALLAQLAQIATVAIENARLYEELRRKDQRKDEFLAMLAHELRNPLAAIRNAVASGQRPGRAPPRSSGRWRSSTGRCGSSRGSSTTSCSMCRASPRARCSSGKSRSTRPSVLHSAVETVRPLMEERGSTS